MKPEFLISSKDCPEAGSSPKLSESSESTNTSVGLFSLVEPKLIPSTSLEALTTCTLLMWANRQC